MQLFPFLASPNLDKVLLFRKNRFASFSPSCPLCEKSVFRCYQEQSKKKFLCAPRELVQFLKLITFPPSTSLRFFFLHLAITKTTCFLLSQQNPRPRQKVFHENTQKLRMTRHVPVSVSLPDALMQVPLAVEHGKH